MKDKPVGQIKLKEAVFKCPWGEKELYIGRVFDHPQWEDGTVRPITVIKKGEAMFTALHSSGGIPLGEFEVVFI